MSSMFKTSSFVLMMIFVISLSNFDISFAARLFLDRQTHAETSTDHGVSDSVRDKIHQLLHPMSSSSIDQDIDPIMSDMPNNFPTTFRDFPTDHDGLISSHVSAWKDKAMERLHHRKQESVTPNTQPEETPYLSSMETEPSNPTTPTPPALPEPAIPAAASVTTTSTTAPTDLPESSVTGATTRAYPTMPATAIPSGSIPMQQGAQVYQPVRVLPVYNSLSMAAFPTGAMPALAYAAGVSAVPSTTMQGVP